LRPALFIVCHGSYVSGEGQVDNKIKWLCLASTKGSPLSFTYTVARAVTLHQMQLQLYEYVKVHYFTAFYFVMFILTKCLSFWELLSPHFLAPKNYGHWPPLANFDQSCSWNLVPNMTTQFILDVTNTEKDNTDTIYC